MTPPPGSGSEAPAACPSCGAPVWPEDNFCEACRTELRPAQLSGGAPRPAAACPSCQGSPVTADGYCETCGRKVPAGDDHSEIDLGLVAGVTDRGLRHSRNEDAMAMATAQLAGGPAAIAVVCDGVSTSNRPDEASKAAAQAAMAELLGAVRTDADLTAASQRAFGAARQALLELAAQGGMPGNAPSATFAASVVTGRDVTVCWLGDSRVYWLAAGDPAAARQLTSDDSVAQELVARGIMSPTDAMASPVGHVVTGWIGADLSEAKPHLTTFAPEGPGAVLLCSDGLWNYQQDAAGLAARALPAALTDPLTAARELVTFAIESGGGDNITVVIVPFPPRQQATSAGAGPTAEPPTKPLNAVIPPGNSQADQGETDR
jgi:serine/threonine protein phosphatase PrpC